MFTYIVDTDAAELLSAIDITLQRFTEYHALRGAFGRRAVIEQAKGILMAARGVPADEAFAILREHSQHRAQKIADVAAARKLDRLLEPSLPHPASSSRPRHRAGQRPEAVFRAGSRHEVGRLGLPRRGRVRAAARRRRAPAPATGRRPRCRGL